MPTMWFYDTPAGRVDYRFDARFACMLFSGVNRVEKDYGRWGWTRGGGTVWHGGLDVDTLPGTDWTVYSTVAGRVKWARMVAKGAAGWGETWQWGWFVWIVAADGTQHILAHMAANSLRVAEGQQVRAGQALGTMGKTGNAGLDVQAEHVHYEVRSAAGKSIDPTPWCGIPNLVGQTTNPDHSPSPPKEGKTMIPTFTPKAKSRLEVLTKPDVMATVPDGKGGTLRWPEKTYAVYATGPIKNGGSVLPGVQLKRADGSLAWAAKLEGKYADGSVSLADAEKQGLVGGVPPDCIPKATYDAVTKDRDAQKAAKDALQKETAAALKYIRQAEDALEQ